MITRSRSWFSAAHEYTEDPSWKEGVSHGHTYTVTAEVEGDMDPKTHRVRGSASLAVDLESVCMELDGRPLEKMMAGGSTTPEGIAAWILERLAGQVPKVRRVTVGMEHPFVEVTAERDVDR